MTQSKLLEEPETKKLIGNVFNFLIRTASRDVPIMRELKEIESKIVMSFPIDLRVCEFESGHSLPNANIGPTTQILWSYNIKW